MYRNDPPTYPHVKVKIYTYHLGRLFGLYLRLMSSALCLVFLWRVTNSTFRPAVTMSALSVHVHTSISGPVGSILWWAPCRRCSNSPHFLRHSPPPSLDTFWVYRSSSRVMNSFRSTKHNKKKKTICKEQMAVRYIRQSNS